MSAGVTARTRATRRGHSRLRTARAARARAGWHRSRPLSRRRRRRSTRTRARGRRSGSRRRSRGLYSYGSQLIRDTSRLLGDVVAGVQRRLALDEHDQTFVVGDRIVTHTLGHDEEVAFAQLDATRFHLDAQRPLENEEELVFAVVAVPRERSVHLRDLHERIVELGDHARRPELGEFRGNGFRRNDFAHVLTHLDWAMIMPDNHYTGKRETLAKPQVRARKLRRRAAAHQPQVANELESHQLERALDAGASRGGKREQVIAAD